MKLTDEQRPIAEEDHHSIAIALPGSGKTFTIVAYISTVIQKQPDAKVLAISFTRKAASELRERIEQVVPRNSHVDVMTFDGLFRNQLMKMNGRKSLNMVNDGARDNLIMQAMRELEYKGGFDDAMAKVDHFASKHAIKQSEVQRNKPGYDLFCKYEELRRSRKVWDFAAIARTVVKAQETGAVPLLDYDRIIIDEYQDASDLQYFWIKPYAASHTIVMTCGDDDQAIYGWRGAKAYQNFMSFKEDFAPHTHVLNTCFRCKPAILNVARILIEHNDDRVAKNMRSVHAEGGMVQLHGAITPDDEATMIVNHVSKDPENWAILARRNIDLQTVQATLEAYGIDFITKDPKSIFDSPAADILMKLARTILKGSRYDIPDILAFIGLTEAEISHERSAGGLKSNVKLSNYSPPGGVADTVAEHLFVAVRDLAVNPNDQDVFTILAKLLHSNRKLSKKETTGIEILLGIMQRLDIGQPSDSLKWFVKKVNNRSETSDEGESKEGVELLTLHSSKGLQWRKVWILGLNDGVCPSDKSTDTAEEARLLYVGMTRAMDQLHMSYVHQKSDKVQAISPFLVQAMPEQVTISREKLDKVLNSDN
ncbi:ATP-dependent helicase [Photobacterium sp. ZSDE20]|uniref:DNA 3'-5' helicase n=1 Tax=Photobacterium pectinilyticum TaxID=2906793 RepID=A0ABT1N6B6_9GAMM|nr:ATP-dependent helicase [Photobacterium sp. ZSDE20]MCQ1060280.1 ATP-dependent helicase [Photobacterium sp. ZSDE20]MDD1826267.1 ATP-dependent helicase [Photobacterium sp. ZSDE20]